MVTEWIAKVWEGAFIREQVHPFYIIQTLIVKFN